MKTFSCLFLIGSGICLLASPVQAKPHHPPRGPTSVPLATPAPEPPPLPAEIAPRISPDAPPSTTLQPFLDAHLSKILAPLGQPAFAQPEVIASMKAGYADGLATAPETHKAALQVAQSVCDAIGGAMTERQNSVTALHGALATRSSEVEQPRGGVADGTAKARQGDAFFSDSVRNAWTQRAEVLRQNISGLYLRERAIERQVGAWTPAASAGAPPVPATAVPVAQPQGQDAVAGNWMWEGKQPVTVTASGVMEGSRHGSWNFVSNGAGGGVYEFRWRHEGWVDYLSLSADGRTLDGKNQKGTHISARRQ